MRRFTRICLIFGILLVLWLAVVKGVEDSQRLPVLLVSSYGIWLSLLPGNCSNSASKAVQAPVGLIGLFGVYSVASVLIGVANFPSRPEEAAALRQVRSYR